MWLLYTSADLPLHLIVVFGKFIIDYIIIIIIIIIILLYFHIHIL